MATLLSDIEFYTEKVDGELHIFITKHMLQIHYTRIDGNAFRISGILYNISTNGILVDKLPPGLITTINIIYSLFLVKRLDTDIAKKHIKNISNWITNVHNSLIIYNPS